MTVPAAPLVSRRGAWYALSLLALINLLNYLDRNVIFALFEPIKQDLGLTDTQLGWLGSAYVLVFSLAALPFGVLSDVKSRRGVIAGGVALWSAFTAFSGLVRNFAQLFLCRAAVGVGEAAFGPASASLTADYFPGKDRSTAMAVLNAGVPLGGVLGLLLGGWLEHLYGWRVAFMAVGLPGFLCAVLVMRLVDPTRVEESITVRRAVRDMGLGTMSLVRTFLESIVATLIGLVVAWILQVRYGAGSEADAAAFAAIVALGLVLNISRWVRLARRGPRVASPWARRLEGALADLVHAVRVVLRTPTLVYLFLSGAMISFGLNGLVGWGPTLLTRTFDMTAAEAATMLGTWGLIAGVSGTLIGGVVADGLSRYTRRARVLTVALGMSLGAPIAIWLLLMQDLQWFVPMFALSFFFLSWYNGPQMAVLYDVVPSRIGSTVGGAYLLFIHLAGDAIAFPLVGALSDQMGLGRAVLVLPIVSLIGGLVILGAMPTVVRDMDRVQSEARNEAAGDAFVRGEG
jgi:MFS family permease